MSYAPHHSWAGSSVQASCHTNQFSSNEAHSLRRLEVFCQSHGRQQNLWFFQEVWPMILGAYHDSQEFAHAIHSGEEGND
jgi:hypothetical protein